MADIPMIVHNPIVVRETLYAERPAEGTVGTLSYIQSVYYDEMIGKYVVRFLETDQGERRI